MISHKHNIQHSYSIHNIYTNFLIFQTMIAMKERKEMEDLFKKAQKPWAKLLTKVEKTKADYHASCKTEKSASNQERNASSDSSLSPDQVQFDKFLEFHFFLPI